MNDLIIGKRSARVGRQSRPNRHQRRGNHEITIIDDLLLFYRLKQFIMLCLVHIVETFGIMPRLIPKNLIVGINSHIHVSLCSHGFYRITWCCSILLSTKMETSESIFVFIFNSEMIINISILIPWTVLTPTCGSHLLW